MGLIVERIADFAIDIIASFKRAYLLPLLYTRPKNMYNKTAFFVQKRKADVLQHKRPTLDTALEVTVKFKSCA